MTNCDPMIQLYCWSGPTEMMHTEYGLLTVEEWLHREWARITADSRRQAEIRTQNGKVALFVNRIAGSE